MVGISNELIELPEGWEWITLEEIASHVSGVAFKSGDFTNYGIQVIRLGNVYKGELNLSREPVFLPENFLSSNFIVKPGDIVISQTGTRFKRDYGYFVLIPNDAPKLFLNQRLLAITCHPLINSKYIVLASKFKVYQDYFFSQETGGVNQGNVGVAGVMKGPVPLAPINEQKRIVAKIEELNDRTQKAKEALDSIPQLCDRFRQSVLAAAFRGDLTADWREENLDVEPASILLEKLKKRSPQLENDLSEYDLSDIPDSWIWINVESIGDVKGGKRLPKGESLVDENTGYPYIKAGNLKNGTVILSEIQFIPKHIQPLIKNYTVASGDVYITIVGACIGDAGIIPTELDGANLTENAAKICNLFVINNEYLSLWLRSSLCQEIIKSKILSAAQGKLALTRIKTLPIPLPPIQEQLEIISRVRDLVNFTVRMTQCYISMNPKLDQLNQSILAKAFRGELVPQDPDDEPASVLLERIRAERDKLNNSKAKSDRTSKRKRNTVEGQGVLPGFE
ncbi:MULTISPECIES: restriction endonuclease subunit S [Nostoc]|uniref:Restriction endonuclease subunit S n=1 Tax=Nostoc paludosum FACHB-159 TaxID=2692908 RepID=A0ABR8KGY2_9NOSO|nr:MULTISPECIES: restriction endonuclease subunit S [Nostoc]MBD2681729.1 restriction endonuclease subunit S [Nostoc sp. FACHB-857]MBD2738116.1 restriction endonuclease subunit S [Nostoc paludosum FACHB-159]